MKKLSFYFFIAILLPLLILGYLGYNTFAKRREAVKNLLASSLWVSAEAALRSIEDALLEDESSALRPENFSRLVEAQKTGEAFERYFFKGARVSGRLFLLDDGFQIVIPRTAVGGRATLPWPAGSPSSPFQLALARAESAEFADRDYSRAAELFERSRSLASSPQEHAIALEGLGRALLLSRKYDDAHAAYSELVANYAGEENRTGHPFGVIGRFQLSEIERRRGNVERGSAILLEIYQKLRNGVWPVSQTGYEFFASEVGSRFDALKTPANQGRIAATLASFDNLRLQPSPYLEALAFAHLLQGEAITEIRRKVASLPEIAPGQKGRSLIGTGKGATLVSFCILSGLPNQGRRFGGFYWEPESLKQRVLPQVLSAVSGDSGLRLQLVDEIRRDIVTGEELMPAAGGLSLPFDEFPFPWKLVAAQPARSELEREVHRENILYGIYLAVIVTFMFLGAILILRDIAREKASMRQRAEFVNNISHEFKTPLTLIRLYTETMERQEALSRDEKKGAYEIITKEVERLTHMINNVLDFSRIEMGRKEFRLRRGDLADDIRRTLNSYRYHLEKKGFLIQSEIAGSLPPMEFDEEAMAGVLINLLSNAMKFSTDRKEVTVRLFAKDGNAVLQVEDRGIGIPAQERERIFEKFYQVKNEVVAEAGGSGLGLALVKHVVGAHGGRVSVESEPGRGSIFSVILPIERPAGRE